MSGQLEGPTPEVRAHAFVGRFVGASPDFFPPADIWRDLGEQVVALACDPSDSEVARYIVGLAAATQDLEVDVSLSEFVRTGFRAMRGIGEAAVTEGRRPDLGNLLPPVVTTDSAQMIDQVGRLLVHGRTISALEVTDWFRRKARGSEARTLAGASVDIIDSARCTLDAIDTAEDRRYYLAHADAFSRLAEIIEYAIMGNPSVLQPDNYKLGRPLAPGEIPPPGHGQGTEKNNRRLLEEHKISRLLPPVLDAFIERRIALGEPIPTRLEEFDIKSFRLNLGEAKIARHKVSLDGEEVGFLYKIRYKDEELTRALQFSVVDDAPLGAEEKILMEEQARAEDTLIRYSNDIILDAELLAGNLPHPIKQARLMGLQILGINEDMLWIINNLATTASISKQFVEEKRLVLPDAQALANIRSALGPS